MQSYLLEEKEQKDGRLLAIVEALQEIEFVIGSMRNDNKLSDGELMFARQKITEPIFLYANFLKSI